MASPCDGPARHCFRGLIFVARNGESAAQQPCRVCATHSSDVEEEADAPLAGKKAKVHCRSPFAPVLVDITDMTYTDAAGMAA
eukprot:scaffold48038_cov258-Isochrysis_galbana.AAC.1